MSRKLIGIVVSDVQDKTIVVKTERRVTHPIYRKQYTVSKKYQAHDEKNEAQLGDKVSIVETRPVSKNKTFKLEAVIERKEGAAEEVVA
ncbi:MAG: 30S ribosomal protein S17 [Candidatus Saccharimonadales bacterium]